MERTSMTDERSTGSQSGVFSFSFRIRERMLRRIYHSMTRTMMFMPVSGTGLYIDSAAAFAIYSRPNRRLLTAEHRIALKYMTARCFTESRSRSFPRERNTKYVWKRMMQRPLTRFSMPYPEKKRASIKSKTMPITIYSRQLFQWSFL